MPSRSTRHALDLAILRQPDDATCGPPCLPAVYRYFGEELPLGEVTAEVRRLAGGGTLAVSLANHALRRGYRALIYTYNLTVFDPTWFGRRTPDLIERLRAQAGAKMDAKLSVATDAYLEFLALGGELAMEDLTPALLRRWLERDRPIPPGLFATL